MEAPFALKIERPAWEHRDGVSQTLNWMKLVRARMFAAPVLPPKS